MECVLNDTPHENSVDAIIWRLYKHFPGSIIDNEFSVDTLTRYVKDHDICTEFAYDVILARVTKIQAYRSQLHALLDMPQVAQRSDEWYELRRGRLTASAVAQAIGKGKFGTRPDLLKSKAFPELDKPFDSMGVPPLRHGIILEDMTGRCYSQRLGDIRIHNFGMIPHPALSCFGASPDGINELGIMVEIKTPYRRRVDGNIPYEYDLQMQGQMAVCDLPECDFVDADIKMSMRMDEYIAEIPGDMKVDHGIIVEYMVSGVNTFDYSPEYLTPSECLKWANDMRKTRGTTMPLLTWRLRKICIKRLKFNDELWSSLVPQITQFWSEVVALRAAGVDSLPVKPEAKKRAPKAATTFIDSDDDVAMPDADAAKKRTFEFVADDDVVA